MFGTKLSSRPIRIPQGLDCLRLLTLGRGQSGLKGDRLGEGVTFECTDLFGWSSQVTTGERNHGDHGDCNYHNWFCTPNNRHDIQIKDVLHVPGELAVISEQSTNWVQTTGVCFVGRTTLCRLAFPLRSLPRLLAWVPTKKRAKSIVAQIVEWECKNRMKFQETRHVAATLEDPRVMSGMIACQESWHCRLKNLRSATQI